MRYSIQLENAFKNQHLGDTGPFPDMQSISEHCKPDLPLIRIGGNFTMDPEDAAFAAGTWINPKNIIPIHYGADPIAKGTLAEFQAGMRGSSGRCEIHRQRNATGADPR